MYLTALRLDGFRNIKNQEIFPLRWGQRHFRKQCPGQNKPYRGDFLLLGARLLSGSKGSGAYPLRAGFFKPFGRLFFKGTKPKNGNQNFKGKKENSAFRRAAKSGFPPFAGEFGCVVFFPRRPFSHKKRSRKQKKIFGHGSLHAKAGLPKAAFKL